MLLKKEYRTETKLDDGYYVISQESSTGDSEEIWLTRHQVECLISDMKDNLGKSPWGDE